jgi:phenylalanyl-tRNA synthetase beta chain
VITDKKEIALAEMSLPEIIEIISNSPLHYVEPSKYPALERDLAFVVDEKILYNDLYEQIKNFHPLIAKVELFDVYSGKNLSDNKKSLAFHLSYQSNDKTLIAKEVDEIQKELIGKLAERFDAQIRDF